MRIQEICLHNYRIYGDLKLFLPKSDKDIQIIVGKNGVGKTTFLNAINWCLYGDEPHAYSEETGLPILKLNASDDIVSVKLVVGTKNGTITFSREKIGNRESILHVEKKMKNGELIKLTKQDEVYMEVDGFVPQMIREFFFFDGEQLDNYFLNSRTRNIEGQVFKLSNIVVLEEMINHLSKKVSSINRLAGSKNKNLDSLNDKIAIKEESLNKEKERKKSLIKDIEDANSQIEFLSNILRGIPDIDKLEDKKNKLKKDIASVEDKLEDIEKKRASLLVFNSSKVLLHDAIFEFSKFIDNKIENNELPERVDEDVIHESLDNNRCDVCGRELDDESIEYLKKSLANYKLSNDLSKLLLDYNGELKVHKRDIDRYKVQYDNLVEDTIFFENKLDSYKKEQQEVDSQYIEHEGISKSFHERKEHENNLSKNNQELGAVNNNIKYLKDEIASLKKDLEKAMDKQAKTKILNKKKKLCEDALELVKSTKHDVMDYTRRQIQDYTKNTFFKLLWKKGTYVDVVIPKNYMLELIHSQTNENSLGSASAAERELLALAFTLGIHSVSGFNSPLLIDTPLARVSDEHRVNFAKTLLEISEDKQIILLLTPAEYSEDIKVLFNNEHVNEYTITLSGDETISNIGGNDG